MRLVILTVEAPNQAALCHQVKSACELVGIVLSRNIPKRPPAQRIRRLLNRIEGRVVGLPFVRAWHAMQRRFDDFAPRFPDVPMLCVPNINDPQTLDWLKRLSPDLVLVSGTNLIGQAIRDWAWSRQSHGLRRTGDRSASGGPEAGGGIINLHTGLSPYVKGGPDCTNWCLAEGTFHLIGNTILWLDAGVDSGPVLATEHTLFTGQETLVALHWNVMTHAHDLCVRAVKAIAAGRTVPRIPQDRIAEGRTFSSVEWNGRAMRRAWRNFRRDFTAEFVQSRQFHKLSAGVKVFPLIPPSVVMVCQRQRIPEESGPWWADLRSAKQVGR